MVESKGQALTQALKGNKPWLCVGSWPELRCHRCLFWLLGESPSFHIASLSLKLHPACSCGFFYPLPSLRVIQPGDYLENVNTVHARTRLQSMCCTVIVITAGRDSWFLSSGGRVAVEREHKHPANDVKDWGGTEWILDRASKLLEKYTAAESQ